MTLNHIRAGPLPEQDHWGAASCHQILFHNGFSSEEEFNQTFNLAPGFKTKAALFSCEQLLYQENCAVTCAALNAREKSLPHTYYGSEDKRLPRAPTPARLFGGLAQLGQPAFKESCSNRTIVVTGCNRTLSEISWCVVSSMLVSHPLTPCWQVWVVQTYRWLAQWAPCLCGSGLALRSPGGEVAPILLQTESEVFHHDHR
jgi:hypothetical protein